MLPAAMETPITVWLHDVPPMAVSSQRSHSGECGGVPSAAVSHVGAPSAPRAQRHAQPRLPGLVVLVEVQPKAQEPKALVRAGCQQDQELLDNSLKGKEKPKRQLRKHPWCVLHRSIRWCTDLVNRHKWSQNLSLLRNSEHRLIRREGKKKDLAPTAHTWIQKLHLLNIWISFLHKAQHVLEK